MPIKIVLVSIALLLSFSPASAEMYQWVDESGVVTFKDAPPPASKKLKKVKVYSDSDFAPAPPYQPVPATRSSKKSTVAPALQPSTPKKVQFTGTVEMYVTEWCGYCTQAKNYMNSKNISYVAYDIERDSAANQRHKELGGRGVPLIIIGANRMSGFSVETFEYYFNNSR